ncbi:MAG TPA: BamA/TamA family outer membrane protein [Saprospiraceae bacterium]|nr:BamA/TamA family outer membrane protein [Saprospiraceae bacterium]
MLSACSATKYVPEGDFLYKGTSVKMRGKEVSRKEQRTLSEELETIMRPKPNRAFLGIPFRLHIYSFWGTPGKEKGLGNWISRKVGEPPVLMSTVRPDYQRNLVVNRLENRGYFRTTLESDSTIQRKKIKFNIKADPGRQYLIDTVYFPMDTAVLAREMGLISENSFLRKGEPFDLDVIKAERERINARLKEQGFYYFSPDHLLILTDTTGGTFSVNLSVIVRPGTSPLAQEKFTIHNIFIYPQHSLADTAVTGDTMTHKGFIVIDPEKTFKSEMFDYVMAFEPGDLYNRTDHNRSLNRLIDLGVFKYVENKFLDAKGSQLDVYYYLTPFQKKSLRVELQGRNTSTNFAGAEINVSWQNRNAFRSAENVKLSVYGGADFQISGINKGNNLYRLGAEINFNIPRFITPFRVVTPASFIPRTKFSIGFDKLNRVQSYVLNSFRASFGYRWKENIRTEHELTVFAVNYIQPTNITPAYEEQLAQDPTLANAIQRQFILGPSYNYNFTNTIGQTRKHTFYYNGNIGLSGNIPGLLSGASYKDGDTKKILNAEFSQYIKTDHDGRYYNNLGHGSIFAARLFAGIGFAYGNSQALPFVKQYFAGGSSGLRAFRARALGPGSFITENIGENVIAADQTADIKLEVNLEYRPKISGILNGALFLDAGNIWLLREDPERPGAAISGDFLNELAVGVGFGLRFDFSFFVLRGDLAFPLRKPWYPEKERWVLDEISFEKSEWRRENLVFNLAIGYPF